MPKYLIEWDAGYGKNFECIEADSLEEASGEAYEQWRQDAESNAEYGAKVLTRDVAEKYGLEDQLENDE